MYSESTAVCVICSDIYSMVTTDVSVHTNMLKVVVDASELVNCSGGSRVFATNVVTNQVYSTPLKNSGSMTCVADWYGVFATQEGATSGPFSVKIAFVNLGADVVLTPSYSMRLGAFTTNQSLTEPQLVISSITSQPVNSTTVEYETTVQLSLGAQTQGCTFPSTINLVLGSTCRPSALHMTSGIPGQYKWLHTYEPVDITGCGADTTSDPMYFKLPMSLEISHENNNWNSGSMPSDRVWCFGERTIAGPRDSHCFGDSAYSRPAIAAEQNSTIYINRNFVSNTTAVIDRVELSVIALGVVPCTGYFESMGRPWLKVKATGSSVVTTWSASDKASVSAILNGTSDCGDMDPLTLCALFVHSGCQRMNSSLTCTFANMETVPLIVVASNMAGVTTTAMDPYSKSSIPSSFTNCPMPQTKQNVTARYTVAFSAAREDGESGISLYRPIVSTLAVTNLASSGAMSFYINDATIQLRVPGSSSVVASRTFTRADKQWLMHSLGSPYYTDAHYCRTAECAPFYSPINSNALTIASKNTYNASGLGYKSCSVVKNQDTFVFTPSDWGMDRYPQTNLEMRFLYSAVMITSCGSSSRRELTSSAVDVVYVEVISPIRKDVCQVTKSNACKKECIWVQSKCQPKSTVARWACNKLLTPDTCALNRVCRYSKKAKKCLM